MRFVLAIKLDLFSSTSGERSSPCSKGLSSSIGTFNISTELLTVLDRNVDFHPKYPNDATTKTKHMDLLKTTRRLRIFDFALTTFESVSCPTKKNFYVLPNQQSEAFRLAPHRNFTRKK